MQAVYTFCCQQVTLLKTNIHDLRGRGGTAIAINGRFMPSGPYVLEDFIRDLGVIASSK